MRKFWQCLVLVALLWVTPRMAVAAAPDPSVGMEIESPAGGSKVFLGDSFEVSVKVTDPFALVRRVFIRLAAPDGKILNADQEATQQGDHWRKALEVPGSVLPGKYTVAVEADGDGGTKLQWGTLKVDAAAAKFGLKLLSPIPNTVFHRNEAFDVVAQIEDPKKKTRRVFIFFEELKTSHVINGDREAEHHGNNWTQHIMVPATSIPGKYRITVQVFGEGMQPLGLERVPVGVSMAPVNIGEIAIDPAAKIHAGQTVKVSAEVSDPSKVVRQVMVTCMGPDGQKVVEMIAAAREHARWTKEISLDEDLPKGTYTVEFRALGQGAEVIATRSVSFQVMAAHR